MTNSIPSYAKVLSVLSVAENRPTRDLMSLTKDITYKFMYTT